MTTLIGNRRHAVQALRCDRGDTHVDYEWIGAGCFRNAYLHKPTGVVYKVDAGNTEGTFGNAHELATFRELRKKFPDFFIGAFCRLPKVSGYNVEGRVIIAMEHVQASPSFDFEPDTSDPFIYAAYTYGRQELGSLKFTDMHSENFIVDTLGYVVPIDMASPCRSLASQSML